MVGQHHIQTPRICRKHREISVAPPGSVGGRDHAVSQALSNQPVAQPLSPELALVDPELARVARDQLPDFVETASSSPAVERPPRPEVGTILAESSPPRRSRRRRHIVLATFVVALAVV